MDQLVAPKPQAPFSPTDAAVQALDRLRHHLRSRYGIVARGINAHMGLAVLLLDEFQVWCHGGYDFTWSGGKDERNQAKPARVPVSDLVRAADLIAARYRQIHCLPAPLQQAGRAG